MCKCKYCFVLIALGFIFASSAVPGQTQTFKSSDFLEYPSESQKGYILSSVMMAGVIATQNRPSQAECIDAWVAQHHESGYRPIIEAMRTYPDDHPMGLIVAVLQKECGSFKYVQ